MITLKGIVEHLTKVAEENPDMVNLPVQTSSDNREDFVIPMLGSVSFAQVANKDEYYKSVIGFYHESGRGIPKDACNVVILD